MRRFTPILMLMALILLNGCPPAATFDEPQPKGTKPIDMFPKRLQGKYQDQEGASVLTISARRIIRYFDFDMREHRNTFGSPYILSGDTLIDTEEGTKEIIVWDGDTVVFHVAYTDTLFSISPDNVLKKFKGYYFLNKRYNEDEWTVNKLHLRKGVLTIGTISSPEDIESLRAITESASDTVSTHFSPSRKQFRQFIRQDGFRDQELFYRIDILKNHPQTSK